jgi:cytochrome P450
MTMSDMFQQDWDPTSDAVLRDQRAAYDEMRERCPVAYSDFLGWSLFRHEDIVRVLNDPDTFSNAVSRHLSVPNGMDPPEHTEYRRIIEPYFRPERMEAFEPQCRKIAANLVQSLLERDEVELISEFAQWFAVRVQCTFLGWPTDMYEPLRLWTQKNHKATFAKDRAAMAEIAREFEGYVDELLQVRRAAGAQASDDITTSLLRQQVWARPLRDEEIVSVLRNWTVGEVGTISAAVGIRSTTSRNTPSCSSGCALSRRYCPTLSKRSSGFTDRWWPTDASRPVRWKSGAGKSVPANGSR